MIKNNFLKINNSKFILFSALFFLIGCEVRPNELVESFLDSVKEKNIHQAGNYCTAELRESFENFPSAFKVYEFGIKKIDFNFTDLQKTKEGLVAIIKVKADRSEPPPKEQFGLMRVYLKKFNDKWYINSIDIDTNLTEFKKHPVAGVKPKIFNARPFWVTEQRFSGTLSNFLFKYDKYCKEWEQ